MKELSVKRAKELFSYNPRTGEVRWREAGRGRRMDKPVGVVGTNGSLVVTVDGERIYVHRLAWALHHGVRSTQGIKHLNGDHADNRISNLSEENGATRKARSRPERELVGASWYSRVNKWRAQIHEHGKNIYLGIFDTQEAAHAAYKRAKNQIKKYGSVQRD